MNATLRLGLIGSSITLASTCSAFLFSDRPLLGFLPMIGGPSGSRRSSCGSALRLLALGGHVLAGRENKMPDVPEVASQVTFDAG